MEDSSDGGELLQSAEESRGKAKGIWRPLLLLLLVAATPVTAKLLNLDQEFLKIQDWVAGLGALGPLAYAGIYVVATVAAVPATILTLTAGALFGPWVGTAVVSGGSLVGASLCFLIARYFARDATAAWFGKYERFRRLDGMTERYGAVIVAIARLIPFFPYNLSNYAFGLTRVGFWTYVFWSWLCMLPAIFVFVVLGDTWAKFVEGRIEWPLIAAGFGTLVLLLLVIWIIRGKLKKSEGRKKRPTVPEGGQDHHEAG